MGLLSHSSVGYQELSKPFFTRDMLQVLCEYYMRELESGTTAPSVQSILKQIDEGSVAMCWRDRSGRYVDAWGYEVVVIDESYNGSRWVVGRSRGPDAIPDTKDDIIVRVRRP